MKTHFIAGGLDNLSNGFQPPPFYDFNIKCFSSFTFGMAQGARRLVLRATFICGEGDPAVCFNTLYASLLRRARVRTTF
jgi:hypothetical protein